jgi:hypothetical protein
MAFHFRTAYTVLNLPIFSLISENQRVGRCHDAKMQHKKTIISMIWYFMAMMSLKVNRDCMDRHIYSLARSDYGIITDNRCTERAADRSRIPLKQR